MSERPDNQKRAVRRTATFVVVTVSTVAVGCESQTEPPHPNISPIPVIYEVKFPGGQEGHAKIRYRLPDGTLKFENVPLPWESKVLYFRYRDEILVEATATDANRLVPIQCVPSLNRRTGRGRRLGQVGLETVVQRARQAAIPSRFRLNRSPRKRVLSPRCDDPSADLRQVVWVGGVVPTRS